MTTIISATSLFHCLQDDSLRIFDCRFSLADDTAGFTQYQRGHIPRAQYANLNLDLSAPVIQGVTGRHPLPTKDQLAATFSRWGIDAHSKVVVYDDASGAFAARLWWLLRFAGHGDVAVLDGGVRAWIDAGYAITTQLPIVTESDFQIQPQLTRTVDADQAQHSGLLLDARDEARFRGNQEPIDPLAGHIPGAVCATFTGNLNAQSQLKSAAELRQRFSDLGVTDSPVTCYCGSGVTATHNILALVHAGYAEPALYAGSWSEWITDPARPIARG